MNNSADENFALQERFAEAFARLPEQDIEQFYAQYQLWLLRRRVPIIQKQIETIDEHLAENQRAIQSLQPSAVALAVLARLQANGVGNIELLDQMLERGEDWLDRMMQRLDYCEQVQDFIQGDYTQWCYRSLEGAYDWIDTLLGSVKEGEEPRPPVEEDSEATEKLLLQRLSLDDEEEMLEATLKQPVVEDKGESSAPESSAQEEIPLSVAEQFLMAGSIPGEQGEELAEAEQPPELANWEDLEAPEERPVPWYSVNLAADASTASAQPEEMDEWIKVLQDENATRDETAGAEAARDSASMQSASEASIEQAESDGQVLQAEQAEVPQESERSLGAEEAGVEEETMPVSEGASGVAEPSLASEEVSDGRLPGEMEEAGEVLSVATGIPDGEEITSSTLPQAEYAGNELIQSVDESEAAPELVEIDSAIEEVPENAEEEASEREVAEIASGDEAAAERVEPQEGERDDISQDELSEEQKTEADQEGEGEEQSEASGVSESGELLDEQAAISTQTESAGDESQEESLAGEISGAKEEERPWYEYLDLAGPVVQEQGKVEERVEPEEPAPVEIAGSATNPEIHEYAGESETGQGLSESAMQEEVEREPQSNEQTAGTTLEDDATQPMALRDIQRAQANLDEAAHTASDAAEDVQSAASEIGESETGEVQVSVESGQGAQEPEKVRETIGLITREETGPSAAPGEQTSQEDGSQEKHGPAPQPVQPAPLQPQNEEPPRRRGFWQRLFDWLRGK